MYRAALSPIPRTLYTQTEITDFRNSGIDGALGGAPHRLKGGPAHLPKTGLGLISGACLKFLAFMVLVC
jgi:hypothetical protein